MNSLEYSKRDIKVLKFIHRHGKNCTPKMVTNKFGTHVISTLARLKKRKLLYLSEDDLFVITLYGDEILADHKLLSRSRAAGKILNVLIEIGAVLSGVIVGYFLGS